MRIRTMLAAGLGFTAGYWMGAQAGRERYEELRRELDRLRDSDLYRAARDATREARERAVGLVRERVERTAGAPDEVDLERIAATGDVRTTPGA